MALGLKDFLTLLVRQGQYGQLATLGNAGDQPTQDLLTSVNERLATIWSEDDWKWSKEALKIALAPQVRNYAVTAISGNDIDRIICLIPYDSTGTVLQGEPLREHTKTDFYRHVAARGWNGNSVPGIYTPNYGYPTDYYNDGMVNGVWQIVVDPVPTVAGFIGGDAKALLKTYALADIAANLPIQYFPNDVALDALRQGCLIDVGLLKGMTVEAAAALETTWTAKIRHMAGKQLSVATDDTPRTTRLPPTVARLRRWSRRRCR